MNQKKVNDSLIDAVASLARFIFHDRDRSLEDGVEYALMIARQENEPHFERKNGALAFKPAEFQAEKFYEHFRRLAVDYTYREISAETGVSISTLSRIANGGKFEFENFIAICNWMELPITNYFYPNP